MREIKFRVWSKLDNKFIPWNINFSYELNEIFTLTNYLAFQQYTGLKDKNGKEIYEGDILRYCGINDITYRKPGIVSIGEYFTHTKEFYHYGVRVKRLDMEDNYFGLSAQDKDYLIIGNIFENPEFLENKSF